MKDKTIIEDLAEVYPQLYLDPDREEKEAYRAVVLQGEMPESQSLAHFQQSLMDNAENVDTPAGAVQVVSLRNRRDYEVFVRCMMAAKEGPRASIPATQGASTLITFNWPRIREHKKAYMEEQRAAGNLSPDWNAEFQRFTSVRENFMDMLVVLSCGPYSGLTAEQVGQPEETWTQTSLAIRKYHELTHVICRKQYPDQIEAVWDELVADAIGIYGALGRYDAPLEKRFLGISDGHYIGGRLENYTDSAPALAGMISRTLDRFVQIFEEHPGAGTFEMIPILQAQQAEFEKQTEYRKAGAVNDFA